MMFLVGENFRNIKLACIVDCANYFHEKKNPQGAIKYYRRALRINPDDYYANIGLAGALVMNKMFKESLLFFEKSNSLKKPVQKVLLLMFVAYKALNNTQMQEMIFRETITACKNDEIAAYEGLEYTFFKLDMYDEAEFYWKEVFSIYPNKPIYYYNLGKIYFAQGKFHEALDEFQKVLSYAYGTHEKQLKKYVSSYIKRINKKLKCDAAH